MSVAKATKKSNPVNESSEEITSPIIESSVKIEGHINPFIPFYSNGPELTAVGYVRIPGTNEYSSYTITVKGGEVVRIVCDEPNLKVIAEETAKISFINNFVDREEE